MPSPSSASYSRPDLGAMFSEFPIEAASQGLIGPQVCPFFDVPQQAGVFPILPVEALFEEADTVRASKAGYGSGDYEFEQGSWATSDHGWKDLIDERQANIYRYAIDAERVAAARVRGTVLRKFEVDVAAALQSTTNFTNTAAATTAWTSHAAAVPVNDVAVAVLALEAVAGIVPNTIILPKKAFVHLKLCAQVIDRVKYSGIDDPKLPDAVAMRALSELFGLNVVVSGMFKNAANKGQVITLERIWDQTKATILRVPTSGDIEEPCAARTFHWSLDGSSPGGVFESYPDVDARGTWVRFRMERQVKVLYGSAGYILTSVTA